MNGNRASLIVVATLLLLAGCRPEPQATTGPDSPAGKVGQAAHKAVVETKKAGKEIERHLDQAAHDAREGWQKDKAKRGDTATH